MMIPQVPPRRRPGGGTSHSLDTDAIVAPTTLSTSATTRRGGCNDIESEHNDSHRPSFMLQEFRRRHIITEQDDHDALKVVVTPRTNNNSSDDEDRRQREAAQRRRERWQRGIMTVGSPNSSKEKECRRQVTPTNEDSNWGEDEKRRRSRSSNSTNKGQIATNAIRQHSARQQTKAVMWHPSTTADSPSNYSQHNSCAHVGIDNVLGSIDEIRGSLRDVIITAKQIVTSVRRFGPAEREAVRETLTDAQHYVSERVQFPMTTWMTPVGGGGDVCGGNCRRQVDSSNTSTSSGVERSIEVPRTCVRRVRQTTTREHDNPSNHRHTIPKTKTLMSNRRREQCETLPSEDSDEMCRTSCSYDHSSTELHMLANHDKEVDDNNTEFAMMGITTMEV